MKYSLLLIPCILALLTPLYNHVEPIAFGFPLFYWYLLALIPLSSLFIDLAWRAGVR
jgi:hypothetical protein